MPASFDITKALLVWYDRHRRDLPWRAKGDIAPDPYAVWLSEVMLQQTTVAAVKSYYARFLALWPDVEALAKAPRDEVLKEWAGLGYYARARNLHDCAQAVVSRYSGRFPRTEAELRRLPGIGDYTAAAVAAIAFGQDATVVDGNVERVITRLYAVDAPLPAARPAIRRLTAALVPPDRPGDFAQATMDFGATLCTSKSPACAICPIGRTCAARAAGTQTLYPKKLPKKALPQRFGTMAIIERADGAVLVRTRPSKGMLGGMTEFVGSDWTAEPPAGSGLPAAVMNVVSHGVIDHVFTHFALRLAVYTGQLCNGTGLEDYRWASIDDIVKEPIPAVFAKAWEATRRSLSEVVPLDDTARFSFVSLEGSDEQRGRKREDRKT